MKKAIKLLSKFDKWFSSKFWWIFTNGRKVSERSKIYEKLSVDDPKVYTKAKQMIDSSDHFTF